MKKISIFKRYFDEKKHTYVNQTLRQINVTHSFKGFGRSGKIISHEFDSLALDLEPQSTGWKFLN